MVCSCCVRVSWLLERLNTKHVVRVTAVEIRGTLFGSMLLTEGSFCLNGTVSGLLLIPFEDDKRCPFGAAAAVALRRRVRTPVPASVPVACLLLRSPCLSSLLRWEASDIMLWSFAMRTSVKF